MKNIIYAAFILVLCSCGGEGSKSHTENVAPKVDSTTIAHHIAELSSDTYMGRMPGTEGGRKTMNYIEGKLKEYGVQPGWKGKYRQPVPLVEINGLIDETLSINIGGETITYEPREDFVAVSERPVESVGIENSPLIFCGYGIVAPEYDWNDYEGLDLEGKTAIVLVNDPGLGMESDSLFKGNTMTYYGRWTYKYEEADRQGLDGIIIIHETHMAGYPWFVVKTGWSGPQLLIDQGADTDDCGIKGWLHLDQAKSLFEKAGYNLSEVLKSARQPGFKPIDLNATASLKLQNELRYDTSYNIVGKIDGEKDTKDHVVYTAHWDHLGVGAAVDGDSIYNGALDNASGTGALLAIAKAMSKTDAPDRSAIFAFVTAEEQGLLGSEWYVNDPAIGLNHTIANINLDAANIIGEARDLTITGYGQSEMDEIAERFAKEHDRYVQGEQEPEKGLFFRSDHFNFAKKGVPALYAKGGYDHRQKGKEFGKKFKDDYVSNNYHQPSDEYDAETWDLSGCVEDAQLMLEIGWFLLNNDVRPQWKDGSEFKSIKRPTKDVNE